MSILVKRDEALKKYESELGMLRGYIGKIRSNMTGLPLEQESIIRTIFGEYDTFIQSSIVTEPVRVLGDLEVSDKRIQSLLREKDAEILKLRDRIFEIEKLRIGSTISEGSNKTIEVLQSESGWINVLMTGGASGIVAM